MTKEELKQHCEKQVKMCEEWAKGNGREPSGMIYEEHKLILDLIKALEQQPCDDCVSRADLLKEYENRFIELQKAHQTNKQLGVNWCINTLNDMPSVIPTHGTCKDCSHRDPEDKKCDCGHDILWQLPRKDNWYCADFKKRDSENEG